MYYGVLVSLTHPLCRFSFQEHRTEIDARSGTFQAFDLFGQQLLQAGHYASPEISEKLQKVAEARQDLEREWLARKNRLDECLELQLFYRDCEQAENWMASRESFLASSVGDGENVDSLIKKHEDFDKAINSQENKIGQLCSIADQLIGSRHYASGNIASRRDKLLERWSNLKEAMIEKRSKLGESQTLQQFSRDADEIENWIAEKLALAMDESYKDPANIASKHQKHQAFEAELASNAERVENVIDAGKRLIEKRQCAGSEPAVANRIESIVEQWKHLTTKTTEKSLKLKEANKQRTFNAAVKDIDFWLGEVESLLKSEDSGKDLGAVQHLLKKHTILEADIAAHEDRVKDMNTLADSLIESGQFDSPVIQEKRSSINDRYERIKSLAAYRRQRLYEADTLHKFFRDIAEEEAWIKEKKLLVSSSDYGHDLTGVHNLKKKHKRLQSELANHEPILQGVRDAGQKLLEQQSAASTGTAGEIEQRLQSLEGNWQQLKSMAKTRGNKLEESLLFQQLLAKIEEEVAWISEKQQLLCVADYGDTMAAVQSLLKKQDAFDVDFAVHKDASSDIINAGNQLIAEGNHHSDAITSRIAQLRSRLESLDETARTRKFKLLQNSAYLQFMWKADVVDSWIADKEVAAKSEDHGRDLSSVSTLLAKQEAFDAGLTAFASEGIASLNQLKDQLLSETDASDPSPRAHIRDSIIKRHDEVLKRWNNLIGASDARKQRLYRMQEQFKQIEDLFLSFAKKASAFNSWFENAEEDLTDPVRCNSIEEINSLKDAHAKFTASLNTAASEFKQLQELDAQIKSFKVGANPYTWFTMEALVDTWRNLHKILKEREFELNKEAQRQEDNDRLRRQFAQYCNVFYNWLTETRMWLLQDSATAVTTTTVTPGGGRATPMDTTTGSLEAQLEATRIKAREIKAKRGDLKQIEDLAAILEEHLILDNRYTEHGTVGLAQQWDQLDQLSMRIQHNLEQQIQARLQSGVSEEALKEFSMMFKHFDKNKSGRLDHQEFKSCLRALGYDLPMVEEGQVDPEFEAILDIVDPNRTGVTLHSYISFMISRETENVSSSEEVQNAFKAIATNERPYVTSAELFHNLTKSMAEYCVTRMKPYVDPKTGAPVPNAYDYEDFTRTLFQN